MGDCSCRVWLLYRDFRNRRPCEPRSNPLAPYLLGVLERQAGLRWAFWWTQFTVFEEMRQVLATKFVKSAVKCPHNIALCAFLTTSQKHPGESPGCRCRPGTPQGSWGWGTKLPQLGIDYTVIPTRHTHTDIYIYVYIHTLYIYIYMYIYIHIYIYTLCTWVHRIYTEMCLRYSTNNSHIWSFWLLYEYLIQRPISRHSLPWNVRHVGANPEWRRAAFRGPTSSVFFAYWWYLLNFYKFLVISGRIFAGCDWIWISSWDPSKTPRNHL